MKRIEPAPLGRLLQGVLSAEKFQKPMLEHRALEIWRRLTGPDVWKRTISLTVDGGIIYARISSAPLRSELSLRRAGLLREINNRLERPVIRDIKIL